jgi:hypothetical protein
MACGVAVFNHSRRALFLAIMDKFSFIYAQKITQRLPIDNT